MNAESAEAVTVLKMQLPYDLARGLRRHTSLSGDAAIEVVEIINAAPRHSLGVIIAEAAPTNLTDAVEHDIDDVLGGIAPACPICNDPMDSPHAECEARVMRYLQIA